MQRRSPKPARRKAKSKKSGKITTGKIVKYSVLILFICLVIGTAYNYRHGVLYWLGFKTNKRIESLTKEERKIENLRIYEIVGRHKDKVFGIDVSHYQGRINWDSVQSAKHSFPLHFVFVRATAGKNGKDSAFKTNWREAKERGFIRGAYHYYRPDENSIEQADYFIKTVKLSKGDLPPVLDIEQIPAGQSMDRLKTGLKRWLDKVEEHYGVRPILYSGESFYTDFLKEEFADYDMWIANYSFFEDEIRPEWQFWQFTDKAVINGIEGDVDVNIFNGDLAGLKAMRIN
jgi:lysozyme